MAERVRHELDEPEWVVVAQAEGILSARDHIDILEAAVALRTRAAASGTPIEEVARELVRSRRS